MIIEIKKITRFIAITCLLCVFFNSCRVEKRVYRKGYHVVWNHKKPSQTHTTELAKIPRQESQADLAVSSESPIDLIAEKKSSVLVLDKDTCGDKLLLQNADELIVKITEIDDNFIKYKRCDNLNGPTYSISKNKVALITYANGVKEVILQQAPVYVPSESKQPVKKDVPAKTNYLGLLSLVAHIAASIGSSAISNPATAGSSVLFIVLLWIAAIIMAYSALFQFKNEPGKYKGKWMPVVVIIFNAIGFLIAGLFFSGYGGATGVALILFLIGFVMVGVLIAGLLPKPQPTRN